MNYKAPSFDPDRHLYVGMFLLNIKKNGDEWLGLFCLMDESSFPLLFFSPLLVIL